MRLVAPPAGGATFFSLAFPCKAWHNRIIFLSKVRDTMRAEQNTRWFLAAEAVLYLAFLCCDLQSVFSIPQLLCNAVESLRPSSAHGAPLFRCGLWLFVGCDICVGLHNLVPYLPLSAGSAAAVQFCMWALYLPSQVLIALSVRRRPTA